MRRARWLALAIGLVACVPCAVAAQPPTALEPGRIELGFGTRWTARAAVGSSAATETTSSGGALSLFDTSTERSAAAGFEARIGVRLRRTFEVEAFGTYAVPSLRTEISGDFENAASVTASETVQQFMIGGSVLRYLRHNRARPLRVAPFLLAGGGYLRDLHEGAVLAETGHFYVVGGGVKVPIRRQEGAIRERRRPAPRRAGDDENGRHRTGWTLSRVARSRGGAVRAILRAACHRLFTH